MRAVSPLLCVVILSGCVRNPAKHPSPNAQELRVDSSARLRGDEELDEQDWYHLAGDTKSAKEIESKRSGGVTRQGIGATLIAIGVGIAAAGVYSYFRADSLGISPYVGIGIGSVGGLTVVGGRQLVANGRERVRKHRWFDDAHALAALERGRYGDGGLTANAIATLDVTEPTTFCPQGTSIDVKGAKDKDGNVIALAGHDDWFVWSGTPANLVEQNGNSARIKSPIDGTLAGLGTTIEAKVVVGSIEKKFTLTESFDCKGSATFSGKRGISGGNGTKGDVDRTGGDGQNGTSGGEGDNVDAEAAFVTYKGKRLVVVGASDGGVWSYWIFEPGSGGFVVRAVGGTGGSGGSGGEGGRAGDIEGLTGPECAKLKSGSGGNGGIGGDGGRGGRITVRGPKEVLDLIETDVSGGPGGDSGGGGMSGTPVNRGSCWGSRGNVGNSGKSGRDGESGKVTKVATPASELSNLATYIATSSEVTLDGAAPPTKKKR